MDRIYIGFWTIHDSLIQQSLRNGWKIGSINDIPQKRGYKTMKLKFVGEQKEDKLPPERGYSSNQTNRKPKVQLLLDAVQ